MAVAIVQHAGLRPGFFFTLRGFLLALAAEMGIRGLFAPVYLRLIIALGQDSSWLSKLLA